MKSGRGIPGRFSWQTTLRISRTVKTDLLNEALLF